MAATVVVLPAKNIHSRAVIQPCVNNFLHVYSRHFFFKTRKLLNSTNLNCRRPKWTTPQRDECRTVHALMMMVCSSVNSMNANTRRRDGGIFGGSGAGDVLFLMLYLQLDWTMMTRYLRSYFFSLQQSEKIVQKENVQKKQNKNLPLLSILS